MLIHSCLTIIALLCANVADEKALFSGPQKGEMLPPLTVSRVYGKHRGEVVDFIVKARGRPTLVGGCQRIESSCSPVDSGIDELCRDAG